MIPSAFATVVTGVTASPSSTAAGAAAAYTVDFSTSTTGVALTGGSGTITIAGPAGTQFPLTGSDYSVNGTLVTVLPTHSAANNVTITTPVTVNPAASIALIAGVGATVTNSTGVQTASISVSTSSDITPVPSNPGFAIVAGPPAQVVHTAGGGQTATVNTQFGTLLTATIEDQFGNPVLVGGSSITFTAPTSGASGTFANSTATTIGTTNASGVATATAFTANVTSGSYFVTATSGGLTGDQFTETNVAGAASQIVPTGGANQNASVGTAFTSPLAATIEDSHGNPVLTANTSVTFTAPASGASGTFANGTITTAALTNAAGVATSSTFTANATTGSFVVTPSSTTLTPTTFLETNVTAAAKVVVTGGIGQSTTVGTAFGTLITATVEDSGGSPVLVAGRTVTFSAPGSGASGTFANGGTNVTTGTTNSNGVATASIYTANTTAGVESVTASSVGLTSSSPAAETNVAGNGTQDIVTGGSGQTANAGTTFAGTLSVTIEDVDENAVLVGGTTVTFAAPGSGASGTFANGTNTTTATTNGNGVATSSSLTAGTTGGTYTVTASSAGATAGSFLETNVSVSGAPTGLTATLGNTTVALSWTAPTDNGGSAVTGYDVYLGTRSGGESANPVSGTNLTGCISPSGPSLCTVTGLTNGTADYFTVKAVNAIGPSVASNEASAIPGISGGYDLIAADGGVFSMGRAGYYGSAGGQTLTEPVVGTASTNDGKGYWMVASDGGIFAYGDAVFYGSEGGRHLTKPIVGMAATPDGKGYWLVASDGGIFAFGDAVFYGSEGGRHLTKPIVGMAVDAATGGYWLVASDGGIFAFNAPFEGSTGGTRLSRPIVGMAARTDGKGYWMVASDGGIFTFGDAGFYGSEGGKPLTKPIVGMAVDAGTGGYWLVASDGGIFSFNAPFAGSLGAVHLRQPIVGIANG
jgi:hypothetical protein